MYVCIYLYIYVCMYACMYGCVYGCMYAPKGYRMGQLMVVIAMPMRRRR